MARMREGIRKKAEGWGVSRGSSRWDVGREKQKERNREQKINWPERFNIKKLCLSDV
jgi:hypothetical protein